MVTIKVGDWEILAMDRVVPTLKESWTWSITTSIANNKKSFSIFHWQEGDYVGISRSPSRWTMDFYEHQKEALLKKKMTNL